MEIKRQQAINVFLSYTTWVKCVAISGDGHTLVSGSRDGKMKVWRYE